MPRVSASTYSTSHSLQKDSRSSKANLPGEYRRPQVSSQHKRAQSSRHIANLAYQYPHSSEHFAHDSETPVHYASQRQQQLQHHPHQDFATTLAQMSTSISLPPISTIQREHEQLHAHGYAHGPPPPRTLPPLPSYYPSMQAVPQPEYVQSARPLYHHAMPTSYPLPVTRIPLRSSDDAASMMYGSPRHAPRPKEVKRRTKTGCLTCRKRRIKCGEERPQCRNCIKSKRDCAGYDHSQSQPTQSIQPAPTSAPSTSHAPRSSSSYTGDPPVSPATSSQYNFRTTSSPRDLQDYAFHHRSSDLQLPNINQAYSGSSYPNQRYP